jgi:hypothetical protein
MDIVAKISILQIKTFAYLSVFLREHYGCSIWLIFGRFLWVRRSQFAALDGNIVFQ